MAHTVLHISALLAAVRHGLGGPLGLTAALAVSFGVAVFGPTVPGYWLLRRTGARRVSRHSATRLVDVVDDLSARASLQTPPALYLIESRRPSAFTVGAGDEAGVMVTSGLLRTMPDRGLAGVLAHEVAHIANDDVRVRSIADSLTR